MTNVQPQPMRIKVICKECAKFAVVVPVVEIPILGYPLPVRLQARFGLCEQHAAAFTLNEWSDFAGDWYGMVCDQLRERKKPAINPFPDDPSFKWEEWIVDPNWHAAPREQCSVRMYRLEPLQMSKGMHQRLF